MFVFVINVIIIIVVVVVVIAFFVGAVVVVFLSFPSKSHTLFQFHEGYLVMPDTPFMKAAFFFTIPFRVLFAVTGTSLSYSLFLISLFSFLLFSFLLSFPSSYLFY